MGGRRVRHQVLVTAATAVGLFLRVGFGDAATLDDVKKHGFVQCGVPANLAGFAAPTDGGELAGFDVDYCRAIAAAVLNSPKAVKLVPLAATARFTALQSGQVDVLVQNTSWTMARDTSLGLGFVGVNFYDGQAFLVAKSFGVTSALELSGASVCVLAGTPAEQNLIEFSKAQSMKFTAVVLDKVDDLLAAYGAGRCTAISGDSWIMRYLYTNRGGQPSSLAIKASESS